MGAALAFLSWMVAGCGGAELDTFDEMSDASAIRRDAAPVDPTMPGPSLDAGLPPLPTCEKYCDLAMAHCTGANAQYAGAAECLAFCAHLPLVQPPREAEEKKAASVACRQYWADGPARTSPETYCLAAGPFGGNTCGDRCTAFCDVAISACAPDAGTPAYESQPACATACATFSYRDAGVDGGGEGPDGPDGGDSLNCRLYWLRAATTDPASCAMLRATSEACKDY